MKILLTYLLLFSTLNNLNANIDYLGEKSNLFSNISKDSLKLSLSALIIQNLVDTDEIVYTPAGPAKKSHVHFVDSDHHLNITDSSIQIVHTQTGVVSQEFIKSSHNNFTDIANSNSDSINESGYISSAIFVSPYNYQISYFSTRWIVPLAPTTNNNQIIDLFNGLSNYGYIIQPVLQWAISPTDEGGYYWVLRNWFVSYSEAIFCGPNIKVNPGDSILGIIKLTSKAINLYSYNCSFTVNSINSELQVNNVPNLNFATLALEAYGIESCTDYPPENKIRMTNIKIKTDSIAPFLNWGINNEYTDCGQHSSIMSNNSFGDEIDIYFHGNNETNSSSDTNNMTTQNEINVSPNPTVGILHIVINQTITNNCNIEIYNNSGSLMQKLLKNKIDNDFTIDMQNYSAGLYIIKIENAQKIYNYKIIKN